MSTLLCRNLTRNLDLSTQCRNHNCSGPWMCCCLLLPVSCINLSIASGLFLDKKRERIGQALALVLNSATYLTCQQPSICEKLTERGVFNEKQNHMMNFGFYPLLASLVTARVIIWKPPYSRTKMTCYLNK